MRGKQGTPNLDLVEPLGRNRRTRQSAVADQGNDLGLARSLLCLLEGFHDRGQLAGCGVGRHTILTIQLALDRALAQAFRTGQDPAEPRFVLSRKSLRVSQTQQVAVRPAGALWRNFILTPTPES